MSARGPGWWGAAALGVAALLGGCASKAGPTGVSLAIVAIGDLSGVETLTLRTSVDDGTPREDALAPSGRSLGQSESVNLLFDESLAGHEVAISVEAIRAGASIAGGHTRVTLAKRRVISAEVVLRTCLAAEGAYCEGGELVSCDTLTDATVRTACAFGCDAGNARCNECAPATIACDGRTLVICDAAGVAQSREECGAQGGPCRTGSCQESGCVVTPIADGTGCEDGLFCTVGDHCQSGACTGGAPRDCDDGNACTFDTCADELDACDHDAALLEGTPCDDGRHCIVAESCAAGLCGGGVPRDCDDANPCTSDSCDESAALCAHADKLDDTPCDDGLFCQQGDRCQAGTCIAGSLNPCDNGNPCLDVTACDEMNRVCLLPPKPAGSFCDGPKLITCDGAGNAHETGCAYGCNVNDPGDPTDDACNECVFDPLENPTLSCHADVELLCNAEFHCAQNGKIVFRSCCSSNQCTCDGTRCLEDLCAAAPDVSAGGSFTGDTCLGADNIPGDCNPGGPACRSVGNGGAPEAAFRFSLRGGGAYSQFYDVTLDTSASALADTGLRLSSVCGSESLQLPNAEVCATPAGIDTARACVDGPGRDLLVLCGLPSGDYFGAVESAAGTCGPYQLDVAVSPTALTLDTPFEAGNISRGGVFTGNTCSLAGDFSFPTTRSTSVCSGQADCIGAVCPACDGRAATDCRVSAVESDCAHSGVGGKDAVFYLALPVDSGVDISTAGSRFDTVLYIMESGPNGAAPPGAVRICNDDCYSADGPSHIQTSLPAGLYYVYLDGAAAADCGDYVLTLVISPSATCPNLACEVPTENCVTCPNDCPCQRCGDGTVQRGDGEQCDDSGTADGDGCSARCLVEASFKCAGSPSVCLRHCGDGVLDGSLGEECDDGDTAAGDGCDAQCRVEPSFVCQGEPSVCVPGAHVSACPNAAIPDGNATGVTLALDVPGAITIGDVNVDLAITHPYIGDLRVELTSPGASGATVVLHDNTGSTADLVGNYDLTLTPDVGSMQSFDGKVGNGTWTLKVIDSWSYAAGTLHCWAVNIRPPAVCGNGSCEVPSESCGSCAADCPCTTCGNGVVEPVLGEKCDDGNTTSSDGCSNRCEQEAGYTCIGSPSDCAVGVHTTLCPHQVIPDADATGIASVATVSAPWTVGDATIDVDIRHTYIGDLVVTLAAPDATTVTLQNNGGGAADDIIGNYDKTLTPSGPGTMNSFNTKAAGGAWTLRLEDTAAGDVGTLECWTLNLTPTPVCGNGRCEPPEGCGSCPADCACSACGNGVTEASQGETCDDGAKVGGDGCSATCAIETGFTCSGAPSLCWQERCGISVNIPDNKPAGATDTVTLTRACSIADLTVDLAITHPYPQDLLVDLTSPAGTSVRLRNNSYTSLSGNYDAQIPVSGPGSLSDFNGQASNGTWTLEMVDNWAVGSGTLSCWALHIVCR